MNKSTEKSAVDVSLLSAVVVKEHGSRVPLVTDDSCDATVQKFFSDVRARGGQPLNLHRALANAPKLLLGSSIMAYSIRLEAVVPRVYRELAIIRSVQLNGGQYEEMQHRPMAMSCGLSLEQINAIGDWRMSTLFDTRQRAVLDWSESLFQRGGPSDAQFVEIKKQFSDQEIVELTIAATTYAGFALFTQALRTPLDSDVGHAVSP